MRVETPVNHLSCVIIMCPRRPFFAIANWADYTLFTNPCNSVHCCIVVQNTVVYMIVPYIHIICTYSMYVTLFKLLLFYISINGVNSSLFHIFCVC